MKKELARIRYALKKQNLRVYKSKNGDGYGAPTFWIVDEHNFIQNGEAGWYLVDLAEFAGVNI